MTSEQRVRTALHEEASAIDADPRAWSRLQAAAAGAHHRRRVRRLAVSGALAAAASVAIIVGLARQGSDGYDVRVLTPPSTTVPATATMIAYGADGRVVELSARDGSEVSVVARAEPPERPPAQATGNVSVSADGSTVYYDSGTTVWQVPRTGGHPERVATGRLPVASPDGMTLAFARPAEAGDSLVLRDLATGRERTIASQQHQWYALFTLSWASDSRHLTVSMGWEGQDIVVELDIRTARHLQDGPFAPRPSAPKLPADHFGHVHLGGDSYVAVWRCCMAEEGERIVFRPTMSRIVRFPRSGGQQTVLADIGSAEVRSMSVGADGAVAYALTSGEVWVVEDDRARKLAEGYVSAVWVPTPTAR